MYFHTSLLSPLGIGRGPSFEQTWIPLCFVSTLVKFGTVVLEKKKKMLDVMDNDVLQLRRSTTMATTDSEQTNWSEMLTKGGPQMTQPPPT